MCVEQDAKDSLLVAHMQLDDINTDKYSDQGQLVFRIQHKMQLVLDLLDELILKKEAD